MPEDREATDEQQNPALAVMMGALGWTYDQAISDVPGLGSAVGLANSHLTSCGGSVEKAIDDLVNWQTGWAATTGFVTNIGGIITLPLSIPANLAGSLLIQLRMIAAIAHLRGYDVSDEKVRTVAYICLTASSGASVLQEFGVNFGTKLTTQLILKKLPGALLTKINQAVGFRLLTKAGSTGLINLTKLVPFVSGFIGAGFDALVTIGIGNAAKESFPLIDGPPSGDELVIERNPVGPSSEIMTLETIPIEENENAD